jgi:tripartite-type tricarboxylate transporter receptor subunit TctC
MFRSRFIAAALAALPLAVAAQNFPSRPVTLTVGFAPGGGTDTAARIIAKKLTENIGQPVVVENKAGAGGNIAAEDIANAPPDGYKIHLTSVGPMTVAPAMTPNLRYDPRKDIAPITMGVVFPNVMIVNPGVHVKTLAEWVALAKREPGKHSFGSSGIGGAGHLSGELFNQAAKIDVLHVPYKGGAPLIIDLIGNQIDLGVVSSLEAVAQQQDGKITVLASLGASRFPLLKDVPTIGELFPGYLADSWAGLFVPVGTPTPIIDRLRTTAHSAMNLPDIREKLATLGITPADDPSPEAFGKMMREERAKWTGLLKEIGPISAN